jgi:hypothetical protein
MLRRFHEIKMVEFVNEMVQGPCAHMGYIRDFMLTVDFDFDIFLHKVCVLSQMHGECTAHKL